MSSSRGQEHSPHATGSPTGETSAPASGAPPHTGPVWFRYVVLGTFLLTLWWFGPRVWRILEARWGGPESGGPPVAIDRLGLAEVPDWLRDETLHALLLDLRPRLGQPVGMMDGAALAQLQAGLAASGWLDAVRLERAYPDRLRVHARVRRPVLEVRFAGHVLGLADADGVAIPSGGVPADLPIVEVGPRGGGDPNALPPRAGADYRFGEPFPDGRVLVAAAIADEWAREVAPKLPSAPPLRVVDADNLGWEYVQDPRYSQVLVGLESASGRVVWFHYGLAECDGGPVATATRAEILADVLGAHPGLVGLAGGDLRLRNLWRDALRRLGEDSPR